MYRIIVGILMTIVAAQAAGTNDIAFFNVPTLDDVGLVALAIIVAIAGGYAARRGKKK